jgi:hypothetical protein
MQCDAPRQCAKKGAQMAFTEANVLKTLHGLIHRKYPQGVLYLFPTGDDVTDFSASRFQPLIGNNPETIGLYVTDTNRVNLKRIGGAYLFFRGARLTQNIQASKKTSSKLKSIPVDKIVFDEVDEMPPRAVDLALERMSHSTVKEEYYLSTPTIPDYGIDAIYRRSDQSVWMIHCEACGDWTCLELTFPDCLVRRTDGTVFRACSKCGKEIHPSDGEWVAQYPNRSDDMVGWWISQLCSAYVSPKEILDAWTLHNNGHGNLAEFYNSKLGMAYIEATHRLSIEEVLALCGVDGIESSSPGPCSMGVDQGKDLHVVIGHRSSDRVDRIIHLGIYQDWKELDSLMRNFRVIRCVVDALPETRNARDLAKRFPGKVFLNYYNEKQKGVYKWNEADMTVQCNRTESLDASHKEVSDATLVLPKRCDIIEEFAKGLHNVAKKLEEDELTGSKRYVYVRLGEDHFRHAFNYEAIARQNLPSLVAGPLDLSRILN